MRPLSIAALSVRGFRNLARVDVAFGPRFNVVSGNNGQGKTNLLEALYVVATSKSFRTSKLSELVGTNDASDATDANDAADPADPSARPVERAAFVRARVVEDEQVRLQSVVLKTGARLVKIDDKRPPSLAQFAVKTPAVVFHPGEIALTMGPSAERRRLLDRTALYLTPSSMADLDAYTKALKSRQKTLETRGISAGELSDWEALVVRHGLSVMQHRAAAADLLANHARVAFERIAAPDLELSASYEPSAPRDEASFFAALERSRPADLRRGSACLGPHRDELALAIGARGRPSSEFRPVRGFASQGQHRAVTLSLKSAEISVIGQARDVRPILLLDDVSSELDRARTAALFAFLREQRGQVFLTTTRAELIDTGDDRSARTDFRIDRGVLESVG